jgi:hypothetical protein
MFASLNGDKIANGGRRLGVRGHMETSSKMGMDVVIEFATPKEAFEVGSRVSNFSGSGRLSHILQWENRTVGFQGWGSDGVKRQAPRARSLGRGDSARCHEGSFCKQTTQEGWI